MMRCTQPRPFATMAAGPRPGGAPGARRTAAAAAAALAVCAALTVLATSGDAWRTGQLAPPVPAGRTPFSPVLLRTRGIARAHECVVAQCWSFCPRTCLSSFLLSLSRARERRALSLSPSLSYTQSSCSLTLSSNFPPTLLSLTPPPPLLRSVGGAAWQRWGRWWKWTRRSR